MLQIEIYRKALWRTGLTSEDSESLTTGTIVNLMGTDVIRISTFVFFWFNLFKLPMEVAIGIYLLYSLLGNACLLGFLVMVVMLPLNHYVSRLLSTTQANVMEHRDRRLVLMNEVLLNLRQVKLFAWEDKWEKRIMEARETELRLEEQQLTASVGFTSIAIFNELQNSLNAIPDTVITLLQAITSFRRIENFLREAEIPQFFADDFKEKIISFEDATIAWSNATEDLLDTEKISPKDFMLEDVNVRFPQNELSLICGSTGCGKTLMMLGLLGETAIVKGRVSFPRGPFLAGSTPDIPDSTQSEDWILSHAVAYVSQTAWLQNASIRDNILFGLPYVGSRYKDVLFACALDRDLSILEDGDQTEIGEKGITLSGGQKARVALARAVYSRAQNVLMDDVLSAVDVPTAEHIYSKCIIGPLMQGRTRILITHNVQLCLAGAAYLVYINNRVVVSRTVAEWRSSGQLMSIVDNVQDDQKPSKEGKEEVEGREEDVVTLNESSNDSHIEAPPKVLVDKEARANGGVKKGIYKAYLMLMGGWLFWLILISIFLGAQGLSILVPWWVKKWTQAFSGAGTVSPSAMPATYAGASSLDHTKDSEDKNLGFYFGMYIFIGLSSVIINQIRYAVIFWGSLRGNKKLHAKLLRRVLRTSLRVLDVVPVGRFLNRFSCDLAYIDDKVPGLMMGFVCKCLIVLSSIATVVYVLPIFVAPMLVIAALGVIVGRDYVILSRECKRLESITHSPILNQCSETLTGIATVRAFDATSQFLKEAMDRIDTNVKHFYFMWIANCWVSLRFSALGAIACMISAGTILLSLDHLDASTAGFCLSFISIAVDKYAKLETSFNSVERVMEFTDLDQEAPAVTTVKPPPGWPGRGQIEVQDLEVRYAPNLQPVLKGLTFSIRAREKVGVVGRTGSGKSTLALSLFRFLEASRGSILIDGVNISDIGTSDLRSNLTVIPQDPTLFSGTLRSNMDPFDQFNDTDIVAALRRVYLIPSSAENNEFNIFTNLDTPVSEGGRNFSQGQRQLLCLARAFLKRASVVLMDEATASVDFRMDKTIQRTITSEFSDCTILCIAHRLHTVIEYDRILVLDQGEIKEFASPWELLQDIESLFYKMCQNSGEFEQLVVLAKAKHQLSLTDVIP
ncbi:hypothetical protein DFQ30_002509 [Apophysomyces sp. BC1015]|nr:hypothetical protein DFQ30_002509 [Apophysomyces sp. BC1015]